MIVDRSRASLHTDFEPLKITWQPLKGILSRDGLRSTLLMLGCAKGESPALPSECSHTRSNRASAAATAILGLGTR